MQYEVMLSTTDNPYDPFTQFDRWYAFDSGKGYYSCEYLSRLAKTSDQMSDRDNAIELERAIDSIVILNLTGNYKKVKRELVDESLVLTDDEAIQKDFMMELQKL